jgi:hypothetical protein
MILHKIAGADTLCKDAKNITHKFEFTVEICASRQRA